MQGVQYLNSVSYDITTLCNMLLRFTSAVHLLICIAESEAYYLIDGQLPEGDLFDPLAGAYRTRDNNWVRIHTNFPQ